MKVLLSIKPVYVKRIFNGEKNMNIGREFLQKKKLTLS